MRKYGIPYQGSKSQIAEWVVKNLPEADTIVDLFAGGCAITDCAMQSGKWKRIIANDIEGSGIELFNRAIHGAYKEESRWISRDSFFMLKEVDPYVKWCWSFGNNGREYLYSPEMERFKIHLHKMCFSKTPKEARLHWKAFTREFAKVKEEIKELSRKVEDLCKECNVEVLRTETGTIDTKKLKKMLNEVISFDIRKYMRNALKESGHTASEVDRLLGTNGMAGHYFGASQWAFPTEEAYKKMQILIPELTIPWRQLKESLESLERLQSLESLESLERLESLQSLESLERLQSLERLESLQSLERLESLETSSEDYRSVAIPENAVIYCDIPYKGTTGYGMEFNYEEFYDWCMEQSAPVYISEYWMPEDRFEIVAEKTKRNTMSSTANLKKIERLYRPKK